MRLTSASCTAGSVASGLTVSTYLSVSPTSSRAQVASTASGAISAATMMSSATTGVRHRRREAPGPLRRPGRGQPCRRSAGPPDGAAPARPAGRRPRPAGGSARGRRTGVRHAGDLSPPGWRRGSTLPVLRGRGVTPHGGDDWRGHGRAPYPPPGVRRAWRHSTYRAAAPPGAHRGQRWGPTRGRRARGGQMEVYRKVWCCAAVIVLGLGAGRGRDRDDLGVPGRRRRCVLVPRGRTDHGGPPAPAHDPAPRDGVPLRSRRVAGGAGHRGAAGPHRRLPGAGPAPRVRPASGWCSWSGSPGCRCCCRGTPR